MIKKCSKVLFTILCTFFISLTVTYAKEYTLEELAEAVKEVEPDATYVYVIGEYVFTSEHILTTQDTMLAARTIKTSLNSGTTADDPIYNEMAIVYLEGVLDEDTWELTGFEFVESVVGIATAQNKYEINYIDYEVIETPEYQVVFKNGNDFLATETLAAGTQVQMITDDLEAGITKDDYTLVGWMNEATEEMVDENTVVDGNATYVMVWEAITTKEVSNETELLLALGNPQFTTIELTDDIDVSASVVVGRDVTINGNGYAISRAGTPAYVPGGNNYVLKVYGVSGVIDVNLNDVKLTNSMAAVLVGDNANVTMDKVDLDGNVWGGIEVKDTATTTLTVKVENLAYTDEVYGKPVAWVDNATVENATIDFTLEGSSWTVTEASVKGQVQYYLNADNAKGLVVTNEEELLEALATSDKVSLNGNIELTSALTLDKDVVINGNGNTISSNGVTTATLITINKDVNATLNDVVVDAKSELRAIKVVDGDLTIIGSTVKNGNASSYASGIFVTEEGNVTIENSIVTGNSAGESEPEEYYAKNSSDLWIGSEATGTIKSGTIGNVYVNDNIYGDGGILTVNGGTIDHVYLEYEDGAYAILNYVGGTIGRLSLATAPGVGFSAPNPVYGTYKSGAENRETIVASVATEDALLAALDNAWYDEVELTANVELSSALTLDRDVVIKGNGNELKAGEVSGSLITISDYANVTIDNVVVDANNGLRAIKVTDANLIIKNSTVTGGNASSYASGVFVTEEGNVTIENSVITGNSAGESEPTAYYAQYSSDLWIGSEATGTIKSGTIGNVYVNDNVYGDGGILTVENGTINAVYLEYEDGAYATLNYVGGEITSLLVSTLNGNGDYKTETPVVGQTYKSGVAAE